MFGWNFLSDWLKGDTLDNTIVADDKIVLPYNYDEYQWWNPFDWAGNYDKSIEDYKDRIQGEKEAYNKILYTLFIWAVAYKYIYKKI